MRLRYSLTLLPVVLAFVWVNFFQLTEAENNQPTETQFIAEQPEPITDSANLTAPKIPTEAQKTIPDEIAFEVFLRTVGENNARQLLLQAGFDEDRDFDKIEQIMSKAKLLNDSLENLDKQAKEIKIGKDGGRNFLADAKVKNGLTRLQTDKTTILQRFISRNLQEAKRFDSGWEKLQNYVQTIVKSQMQVIDAKSSSQSKPQKKGLKNVAFVKTFAEKSAAQIQVGNAYLYSTGWNDGVNISGSGTISEQYASGTSYLVSVTITSPSGRTNTTSGDWNYATLSNSTGLSLGDEDGSYNVQANFEADAGGYYDEWGNYYSYGSYLVGSSNFVNAVPPRITLLSVVMSRPRINPTVGQTSDARAIVTFSSSVVSGTTVGIELIDAPTDGNPTYNINSTTYTPTSGGTANNSRTGTLNTATPPSAVVSTFPFEVINGGNGGSPGSGTVNVNVVIGGVVVPPTPTPSPGTTPFPTPQLITSSQSTTLTIATPSPTPTPNPTAGGGCGSCGYAGLGCAGCANYSSYPAGGCPYPFFNHFGGCCQGSPIVIDIAGNGIAMTNGANGVLFDLGGDGIKEQTSWTTANSDEAWLVLDRNHNNKIDDGREMFGNYCDQPAPPAGTLRNGFSGLAEFDKATNGGNGDGKITRADTVFRRLRLWQDKNHNGISEPEELSRLPALDVVAVFLDYTESRRTDEFGNRFKYRAKVRDRNGARVGRWAWDVFTVPPQ